MSTTLAKTREQLLKLARASENKDAQIKAQAEMLKVCVEQKEKLVIDFQTQEQEICALKWALDRALALLTHSEIQPASVASSSTQIFDSPRETNENKKQLKDAAPLDLKKRLELAEPSLCKLFLANTQVGHVADQSAGTQQGRSRDGVHAFSHVKFQHSDLMEAFMESREAQFAHFPGDVDAEGLVKRDSDERRVTAYGGPVVDADQMVAALLCQPVSGTVQSPRRQLKPTSSRVQRLARQFERGATPEEMSHFASETDCTLPSILEEPQFPERT